MTHYTHSSKKHACPVCGRTKDRDCRWTDDVVFCHTHVDRDGEARGYVYRGATKDGMWGQYFLTAAPPKKPIRPKGRKYYFYPNRAGQPLIKVTRIDRGNGSKSFYQFHWQGQQWVKGLTPEIKVQVPIYRYGEVQKAMAEGKAIWMVEGEGCADALWEIGIPATTTLGGSKKYRSYGDYSADLRGARLVLCPDRDRIGVEHMLAIVADYPDAQWCYPYPDSQWWNNLPAHGGLDIADWLADGASAEQILAAVEEQRSFQPSSSSSPREIGLPELQQQMRTYLAAGPSELELTAQVIAWNRQTGLSSRDLWSLVRPIQANLEQVEERGERAEAIGQLLAIGDDRLRLADYLQPDLAEPLERIAAWIGATPGAMLTTLLPIAASLLKVGTELEIDAGMGFYVPPIVFAGIVAPSGSKKSPIQRQLLRPLFRLQEEADRQYEWEVGEYELALQAWEQNRGEDRGARPQKPKPREYHTADATREAIARIQAQQPDRGILVATDELAGLFKGQNQYRNGRGCDRESLLTAFDGSGLKVDRASGMRISIPRTSLSITGTIQPDILRQMMGDFSDACGQWSRFLWCLLPLQPAPFPRNTVRYDIAERLCGVYQRLEQFSPRCYRLNPKAKNQFADWYDRLDWLRLQETHPGLQAVYSKMQGYTGRLALILHCLNAAVDNRLPAEAVSDRTISAAIQLACWFMGQVKLLYAEGNGVEGALEPIYTKLIRLSRVRGWLKAKEVRNYERSFRKASSDAIRSHFRELEAMGYGQTRGVGNRLEWKAVDGFGKPVDKSEKTVDRLSTAGSFAVAGLQENGRQVDAVDKLDISGEAVDKSEKTVDKLSTAESIAVASLRQNGRQVDAVDKIDSSGETVDKSEKTVDRLSTAESVAVAGLQQNGRQVDTVDKSKKNAAGKNASEGSIARESIQIVYLSTASPQSLAMNGFGSVDKVSTGCLPGSEMSTEPSIQGANSPDSSGKRQLQVGDVCAYAGTELRHLKGLNRLTIESIEGKSARVRGQNWYVSQQVALSDLRRLSED